MQIMDERVRGGIGDVGYPVLARTSRMMIVISFKLLFLNSIRGLMKTKKDKIIKIILIIVQIRRVTEIILARLIVLTNGAS